MGQGILSMAFCTLCVFPLHVLCQRMLLADDWHVWESKRLSPEDAEDGAIQMKEHRPGHFWH